MKGKVILERALSKLGLASRGETRQWILEGRLTVDGKRIKDPLAWVTPEKSEFALDGKVLTPGKDILILLHKTKGTVTTRSDEKGRKTIYDLLPSHLHHLHAVGRLDMHTTGLLLLTNDTKLSSYLTNPENKIRRIYVVSVRGEMVQSNVDLLLKGIEVEGDLLQAEGIEVRKVSGKESLLMVTLTEGKNREIRRMFQAVNHEVIALKRISFGPFELGELPLGEWKEFSQEKLHSFLSRLNKRK
ncbi:MAG: pseudouridine synthase [Chlamydiota bacterium]